MCFGGDKQEADGAGARRNEEIEKVLREDRKRAAREVKILLLGAGESGKSTVLKQMRLIHAGGFTQDDRKQWRAVIFSNLVQAFEVIVRAMDEQGTAFENPANEGEPEIGRNQGFPTEYIAPFKSLWADAGAQSAILRGNEYALHDNLKYFFQDIDRLFAASYTPTDQDILRGRLRTTGINETIFDLGSLTYRMFDVGGQRSERKKWIHVFDNVQVVLFLVAISGYDQALIEDREGNQMQEAIMLFETIANSKWFERSAIILFLNKMDLFKEKVESGAAPIKRYFPDYTGRADDTDAAAKFFSTKFKDLIADKNREPYVYYTNATDTDLLRKTMKAVQDMIVQRNLATLVL